jgi:C-terminal peptidase prc
MKRFYLLISLAAALIFSACTQTTSSDDSNSQPSNKIFPRMDEVTDQYEAELYYNYVLLDYFYLYGHLRNELADDYKVYLGKESDNDNLTKGYCTSAYYDVCYMYSQLRDPFTQYFDPAAAPQIAEDIFRTPTIRGIGAEVEEITDSTSQYLRISDIYPGSPAEKAGLQIGDIVVQIDGLSISTTSNFDAMCTGNIGDVIKIVVDRNDEMVVAAVIVDEYNEPSVRVSYQDSIPVIRILKFVSTTISDSGSYGEFLTALKKTEDAKSTIIDLRGNPGGETRQCNGIAAELLSKGDTITIDIEAHLDSVFEGRNIRYIQKMDTLTYTVTADGLGKNRYYVFMADTASASCAELMLSALTSNRSTPVVGQLTYGKQIGQIVDTTLYGGLALITALQGFDKNWESFHDLGIVPDYEIDDPDEQMAKAVELAKKASEKRSAGYGTKRLYHFSKTGTQEQEGKIPTLNDLKPRFRKAKFF